MRILIVIVILQLPINPIEAHSNQDAQFHFGDLIAFPRCNCKDKILFKHYAVYVGNTSFECKKTAEDIFERTGPVITTTSLSDCIFGKLDVNGNYFKDNYLDQIYPVDSDEKIRERILKKYRDCGTYGPLKNNCEHVATYVRYGVKVSVQYGTFSEGRCSNDPTINVKEILDKMKEMPPDYDETCSRSCSQTIFESVRLWLKRVTGFGN